MFLRICKKSATLAVTAILALTISNCGGSATTATSDSVTTASTVAQTTVSSVSTSLSQTGSLSAVPPSLIKYITGSIPCTSGSMTYDIDEVTYDMTFTAVDCVSGDTTSNGSFSFSSEGDAFTLSYTDFTVTSDDADIGLDGDIIMSVSDTTYTVTYDSLTGTSDGTSYGVEGELSLETTSGLINGELVFTIDAETVTCTFTDFDSETATADEWEAVCSAEI